MRDRKALMREVDRAARTCGWPGCRCNVPLNYHLCGPHWHMLPSEFRVRLNQRSRGEGNSPRNAEEIERGISMFKNSAENEQNRARHRAGNSTRNTGGIDPKSLDDDNLAVRMRILGEQIAQIEIKIARVKALIDEAHLRRGTWGSRSVSLDVQARWQQEKRLLLGELNAARMERLKLQQEARCRAARPQDVKAETFDAVFHAIAKEILAGPVYDRIATAAIHRIGESENDAA